MTTKYPLRLLAGDTLNCEGVKREVTQAVTLNSIDDVIAYLAQTVFPKTTVVGEEISIQGVRFIIGEAIGFSSEQDCADWLKTAEGIPEIGMISPRSEDAS